MRMIYESGKEPYPVSYLQECFAPEEVPEWAEVIGVLIGILITGPVILLYFLTIPWQLKRCNATRQREASTEKDR